MPIIEIQSFSVFMGAINYDGLTVVYYYANGDPEKEAFTSQVQDFITENPSVLLAKANVNRWESTGLSSYGLPKLPVPSFLFFKNKKIVDTISNASLADLERVVNENK